MPATEIQSGLRDVVIGVTHLSSIDGERGALRYCGIDIHDLCQGGATFEEVAYLLWYRALPSRENLETFRSQLSARRALPQALGRLLRDLPPHAIPMDVLRTAVSAIGLFDPAVKEMSREATLEKALRLTAMFPSILAAYHRLGQGKEPLEPCADLDTAGNFLYMLTGSEPDGTSVKALDAALVLHADHGMNASTFAAVVTAATLSDMYSAITSAVGTLKGPLHGGANEGVIDNLMEIGSPDRVDAWVTAKFAKHEKIMGFGHAVYRAYDPRATELRRIGHTLGDATGTSRWIDMTERMERAVWEQKQLYPNVDLYSACVYYTLGIPTAYFTPVFAMSRIAGWCAHVMEQYADNKLIRPGVRYEGAENVRYVPLEERLGDVGVA